MVYIKPGVLIFEVGPTATNGFKIGPSTSTVGLEIYSELVKALNMNLAPELIIIIIIVPTV